MISKHVLDLDPEPTIDAIAGAIRRMVLEDLRRRGVVVAISGGIDSALVAALCARALGPERVVGLFLPERESSPESLVLGRRVAQWLGIDSQAVDLTPALEALGCYGQRDGAIQRVIPEYGPGWGAKLVLPPLGEHGRLNVFSIVVQPPGGQERRARLPLDSYLEIVAASNMKQRTRALVAHHHAERRHYAVAGTPNRLEYDQGFFVKGGDGLADFKPIAHLYKTQVYALAAALGVPAEVSQRPPTTDTWTLRQTEEEFYFGLPHPQLDLCLWAHNHGIPAEKAAAAIGLSPGRVEGVFRDIESKRRATRSLHLGALLVEPVDEVAAP
ncbi:MAG: NAD(+) synthase [Deltaproteobacteria bacterium]|nr:NAD(+) synthase [Deltaproteobacteria bacterium]